MVVFCFSSEGSRGFLVKGPGVGPGFAWSGNAGDYVCG